MSNYDHLTTTTTAASIRYGDELKRADGTFWTVTRTGMGAVNGHVTVAVNRQGARDVLMLPATQQVQVVRGRR